MNDYSSDCSNPQQGTEGRARILASSPSGATNNEETEQEVASNKKIEAEKSTLKPRAALKIPPTVKDARKLFVGGLPADVTSEEFHNFFEKFGKVMDSVVMFDRDTQRSRGFGFVSFYDPAVCQQILSIGNDEHGMFTDCNGVPSGHLNMRGKIVEVKSAEPKGGTISTRNMNRTNVRTKKGVGDIGYPNVGLQWQQSQQAPHQVGPVAQTPYYGHPPFFHGYHGMDAGSGMYYAQVAAGYPTYEPRQSPRAMMPDPYNQVGYVPGGVNVPPYYGFYPQYYPEAPFNTNSGAPYQESVMQEVAPGIPAKEEHENSNNNN